MKKYLAILFTVLILSQSCVRRDDIAVTLDKAEIENISRPEVVVTVDNGSCRDIRVKSGRFAFSKNGEVFLRVMLVDRVAFPKCSETTLELPLRMMASDHFAAMDISRDIRAQADKVTVTGEAVVKAGMGRKKIKLRDVPISQILSIFDSEEDDRGGIR